MTSGHPTVQDSTADAIVQDILTLVPEDHVDTNEQAQMRACLISALSGHDALTTMAIAGELIDFLRDHLMAGAAEVRRKCAKEAKTQTGMTIRAMALATGQSHQAVARLIAEANR